MKILSINVNDFGGLECRQKYISNNQFEEWNAIDKTISANNILSFIIQENPTIVSLMEFAINEQISQTFIKSMELLNYNLVQIEETTLKSPSITVCFVKNDLLFSKIENPHFKTTKKVLRATTIKVCDYILYFVHASSTYDSAFWKEILDFYIDNSLKKILIIGDLNLYKLGTQQKNQYLSLIQSCAIDLWLDLGNSNDTSTFIKGGRLDYAICSPNMKSNIFAMNINQSLMLAHSTDHACITIDC